MAAGRHSTTAINWDRFWSGASPVKAASWSKRRITELLARHVREGMSVLDAGCGSGFFSAWFISRGCRVHSLDYSKEALEMAKAATAGKAEGYILADLLDRRLGREYVGRFDVIFTDGLFEHFSLADQDRIMDNFSAALRPGGMVVTFCPNRYSPWELIRPFYMPGIKEEPLTRAGMARLHRGLEVVEKGGLNVLPVRLSPERLLGGVFGMLLYTIARKGLSMDPAGLKAAIVIPAYNAERTIGPAISSSLSQGPPVDEVIVVDDGSTDRTAEIARGYPVRYIYQENAGPARARNTGWKATDADVVLFTDSDCVPATNWVRELIAGLDGDVVGAATGSYDIANPASLMARLIHEDIRDRHCFYGQYVGVFGSYNVAMRREMLERTGGYDESYRRASGEDSDLSYRVLKLGYRISFVPGALVAHHHTTRLMKYLKEQYTHGYWRMKLYAGHPDTAKGDGYTRAKDIVEPPLALLSLLLLPALAFLPSLFILATGALFIIQAPAALRVAGRRRDWRLLALAPMTFVRGYARGLGMLSGATRFYLGVRR